MLRRWPVVFLALSFAIQRPVAGQSLRGSTESLDRQNLVARQHDFTFLDTHSDVQRFVAAGYLVPIRGNANYELVDVSYPYGRPEVRLFIERLSSQYRNACGEKLVVTSLTRPRSRQPPNASPRSVHPTGMAVDLRVPRSSKCRSWLEQTLLSLEGAGVLDATRESNPPHYHVALFPRQYASYVQRLEGRLASSQSGAPGASAAATTRAAPATASALAAPAMLASAASETAAASNATASQPAASGPVKHVVSRGETLWSIARRWGTTPEVLQRANGLRSSNIMAGQVLEIPADVVESAPRMATYRVSRGDTLWTIAQRHGTTIGELRAANGLRSTRIYAGQVLQVPLGR